MSFPVFVVIGKDNMAMNDNECKRPDWHSGYIVTLNTLARFFDDTRDDIKEYCDDVQNLAEEGTEEFSQHTHTYMTFGDFDRITFNEVDRFSRYFDLDKRSKYWLGKHQNIYLYQINSKIPDTDNPGPRLFPYKNTENLKDGNPYYNDFGFCINYDPDIWYLFSSNYGYDAEYNNSEITDKTAIFPFLILTQISLNNDILFRIQHMEEFLIRLRNGLIAQLDDIIEKHRYEVKYEIYGCLNTSELCILWIAEQYTDVLSLLDELKKMEFDANGTKGPLFFTVYSIIGRLMSNSSSVYKSALEKCKGTAQIDIIVNNTCSGYDLLNTIKNLYKSVEETRNYILPDEQQLLEVIEKSCIRVGEHDLSVRVPVSLGYEFFNQGHGDNGKGLFKLPAVKEKILGTRVALLHEYSERDPNIELKPLKFDSSVIDEKLIVKQFTDLHEELNPRLNKDSDRDYIRPLYLWIRDALKKTFSSHTGSVDTLDMMYTDYLSNIHESYNAVWRNDYNYQFKNSLRLLKLQLGKIVEGKAEAKNLKDAGKKKAAEEKEIKVGEEIIRFWKLYPQIIDNIRQQTSHFSQSGRLVMRIPSSHLRYTACCDLMFHGYYGMVKAILFDAYSRQNADSFQSELIPVITTNSNTDIRSKLFFVGPDYYDLRLLHIDIPYSLLYDPVTGFPYMVHEMFHYIVPNSRDDRNRVIGTMIINEVLTYQYIRQFYECIKLFDHAGSDDEYEEKIKHYSEKNIDGKEICHNVVTELEDSLRSVLWNDETLREIRAKIIASVFSKTTKDPTWTYFLEKLEEELSQMPLSDYEKISESLLQNMYKSEQVSDQSDSQKFITCSDSLNSDSKKESERKISDYEKLIYEHKLTLLNPNGIYRANVKSAAFSGIRDTFINGLREASPDMAMVMYCDMDAVSYLVSCARQIDSSISKMTASYEVVRIPIVLAWIYCREKHIETGDEGVLVESLSLPGILDNFIQAYMVEYLPQEPNREKLINLLKEAIVWYWRFKHILFAFRIKFRWYAAEIIEYGKCYRMYDVNIESRTPTIQQLIKTAIDRRKKKINERKTLLDETLWEKIFEISAQCEKDIIDPKTMPEIDKVLEWVEKCFPKEIDTEDYKIKNIDYNRTAFNTSLKFVHQAARQGSLEDLNKEVKVNTGESASTSHKGDAGTPSAKDDICSQIDGFTVKQAWGMTEFTDILQNIRAIISTNHPQTRLWYLAKSENECLLPSVYQNKEEKIIKDILITERSFFYDKHSEIVSNNTILEMFTQEMAVENERDRSEIWKTNMIVWQKDLADGMKQLYTDDSNICLYLFAPGAYLKAREAVLYILKNAVIQSYRFNSVPLIFKNRTEFTEDAHSNYFINAYTKSTIENTGPTDEQLQYVMPMPYIIEKGRYLAYNLSLYSKKGKYDKNSIAPEAALYTMDQIQNMMLRLISENYKEDDFRKEQERKGGDKEFEIHKWAFFYTIKIDKDIVDGIKDLIKN